MKSFWKLLSPQWIIAGIFLLTILLGTCLLMLPFASTANGSISFLSALFTATSALCVTGLTVINIGTELTLFGQLVVLFLIQLGGLGIMTIGTFILVIIGERLSLQSESVLMQTLGAGKSHSLRSLILTAVGFSLIFEILGTILLWLCYLSPPPEYMQLMGKC